MSAQARRSQRQARMRRRSPPPPIVKRRRRHDRCYFEADGMDDNLVHDILSRLPLPDLLAAKQCCRSWNCIISTCKQFHALYDHKNKDAVVIALNSSTDSFPFFQISDKDGKHTRQWNLALDPSVVGENSGWRLVGSSKSLVLFAEKKGVKLCVANPLSRKCRLIPEPSGDLVINNAKNITWEMKSVEMIVNGNDNSLTLLVFAISSVPYSYFSMVYSSLTNAWKVCSLSRISQRCHHFGSVTQGICFNGKKAIQVGFSPLARSLYFYDIETSVLVEQAIEFVDDFPNKYRFRVPSLWIFEYQNNIYFFDACRLSDRPMAKMYKIRIWEADLTRAVWMLFMQIDMVADFGSPISCDSVVCYDQQRYISVFPRSGSRMIVVDLHSKSFRILGVNPLTLTKNKNINSSGYFRNCLMAFPVKPLFNCFL